MILKGDTVSKGKVKGKIKIIKGIEDVKSVNSNHIVVTSDNSPLYSVAYINAKGIISEVGGKLCHLAIVARELKKPAILNVEGAMDKLEDGMLVKMGENDGEIKIIE